MRISWSIGATIYCYLKCIVYDKLLKPRKSFWITLYDGSNNGEFWANTIYILEIPAQLCEHLQFTLLGTRLGSYDCFLCSLPDLVCISGNTCMQLWIKEHKEIPNMMSLINERFKNAFQRGTMEDFMYILNHIIMEKIQEQEENKIWRTKYKTKKQWKRNVIRIYSNHTGVTRGMWLIKNESLTWLNMKVSVPRNTRVGTLIVATIYLQLIQNRYMFRSFTVLQCSHQHCVQLVASDVEVVGYL